MPVHYDFLLLLRSLQSTFDDMARGKSLSFIVKSDSDLPQCLYGDDMQVRQILTSLLSNAIKFTPRGSVVFRISADRHTIRFDVFDTGVGIKAESLDTLFGSPQQPDTADSGNSPGPGMGLATARMLVEMMGGTISAESEYGTGTVFRVTIPRVDGDPAKIRAEAEGSNAALYAPEANVLVVDDHDSNLQVASGLLELSGIRCDTAADGETAVLMAEKKRYDLILMDYMMPGIDGVQTMLQIRQLGRGKGDVPVVALTANTIPGVKDMLIEKGMDDYISKPIDHALLNKILLKWLPGHKVSMRKQPEIRPESPANAGSDESDFIRGLRAIPDIDPDYAMGLMGGREDLYASTFAIAHRKLLDNIKKLDDCFDNGSLHDFSIEVHGLKGALYSIGCRGLGNLAAALESASKQGDSDYCLRHYAEFKRLLLAFHQQTARIIAPRGPEKRKKTDSAALRTQLAAVRAACEEYDSFAACEILATLMGYDNAPPLSALLQRAYEAAESCDYDATLELIRRIDDPAETI